MSPPSVARHHAATTLRQPGEPALNTAAPDAPAPAARRRMLLVAYHFPPDSAVGSRRWDKLTRFGVARGWQFDVITRTLSGEQRRAFLSRAATLAPGVRVYEVSDEPLLLQRIERRASALARSRGSLRAAAGGTARAPVTPPAPAPWFGRDEIRFRAGTGRDWLRAYWAWVDHARPGRWARRAARLGARLHAATPFDVVATSGPPHMCHDAGRLFAARCGVPFVMDMRDPWAAVERLEESVASPVWLRLAAARERAAVEQAALVIANTELARGELVARYPDRVEDLVTVMNGYDEEPLPEIGRDGRFVVAHAGTLYIDRDPRAVLEGAAMVIAELGLTPAEFGLGFMGVSRGDGGFPVAEVAEELGIGPYLTVEGPRPHDDAVRFMATATVLLTLTGSNRTAIPAKTFECMQFDAWLLALSAPGSATESLLRGTGADVVAPNDSAGVARVLRTRYLEHRAGVRPVRLAADRRLSREYQASLLFDAVEEHLSRREP